MFTNIPCQRGGYHRENRCGNLYLSRSPNQKSDKRLNRTIFIECLATLSIPSEKKKDTERRPPPFLFFHSFYLALSLSASGSPNWENLHSGPPKRLASSIWGFKLQRIDRHLYSSSNTINHGGHKPVCPAFRGRTFDWSPGPQWIYLSKLQLAPFTMQSSSKLCWAALNPNLFWF